MPFQIDSSKLAPDRFPKGKDVPAAPGGSGVAWSMLRAAAGQAAFPLSPLQQGMLFNALRAPGSGVDVEQLTWRMPQTLDRGAFLSAFRWLAQRHAALRTAFRWEALEQPVQEVYPELELRLQEQDWRGQSPKERARRYREFLAADRTQGFDLRAAPLWRLTLIRETDANLRCVWTLHHAIMDGHSLVILLGDLASGYVALRRGRDPALPAPPAYRDFIVWLGQQNLELARSFWQARLAGLGRLPCLANDSLPAQTAPPEFRGHRETRLPVALTAALHRGAAALAVTIGTLVQAAWSLLLGSLTGECEVVFGVTRAGRRSGPELAMEMAGPFINTLPVRVQLPPDSRVKDLLQALWQQQFEVRAFEHTPLVQIQRWCAQGRPLFETSVMFDRLDWPTKICQACAALSAQDAELHEAPSFPLSLTAYDGPGLLLRIHYDPHRFASAAVQGMLARLAWFLQGIVAAPEAQLRTLALLPEAERRRVVNDFNNTAAAFAAPGTLPDLFGAQCRRTPDAVAVVDEQGALTFAELDARANQLAHYLQGRGVGPGTLVGLGLERSLDMVVGIVAALKAGAAYVPLDPGYPRERLAFMLEDSGVKLLLTQVRLAAVWPEHLACVVCLDVLWAEIARAPTTAPAVQVTPDDLAYVIYTSGSTGRPKGALVPYRAIVNHMLWMQQRFPVTPQDVVLQKTPISFDASVWELLLPLMTGARLVLARPDGHREPAHLVELIQRQCVTVVQFVPALLGFFLEHPGVSGCVSLRRVFSGGEALSLALRQRVFERFPKAELVNLYGPTETAIDVSYWVCPRNDTRPVAPIGRPVANTQLYVLDAQLQPRPIGVAGELFIGGESLARGYLKRPELTAAKFVPDPFSADPQARLYRTGDRCRWLPDGNVEFLGRLDDQVKIRGFRIELGEIEAALAEHPAGRHAAALVRASAEGAQELLACIVAADGVAPTYADLRAFLRRRLPEHMVPTDFVVVEQMPLTPSGKLDRRALAGLAGTRLRVQGVAQPPRNELEAGLVAVWEQVLGRRPVGVQDDFFELGGHSLLAMGLMRAVAQRFGRDLPLASLFAAPTIEQFARLLAAPEAATQLPITGGLRGAGQGPPLFHVPGIAGYEFLPAAVARRVGAVGRFYDGLEYPGLGGQEAPLDRVEDIAAHLVGQIRRVWPVGPVCLSGHSFGGVVAYEVARQLHSQGAHVEQVLLWDSFAPGAFRKRTSGETLRVLRAHLATLEPLARLGFLARRTIGKVEFLRAGLRKRLHTPGLASAPLVASGWVDDPEGPKARVMAAALRAYHAYRPGPYAGKLVLFQVQDRAFGLGLRFAPDPFNGWKSCARGRLEVVPVPGEHNSVLQEPAVGVLAEKTLAALRPKAAPSA